mgnify:FL=1
MRKKIVAGNWKMNKTLDEGIELASEINRLVINKAKEEVSIIIAPPFTHITEINKVIDKSKIFLAGQNCAPTTAGAYTGEISAEILKSAGASYVIIGHSERRTHFKEDNESLNSKIVRAVEQDLTAIYCCGEKLPDREAGNHFNVVREQIEEVCFQLTNEQFKKVILAYEPVWAIVT